MSRNFNDEFASMGWAGPPASISEASKIISPELSENNSYNFSDYSGLDEYDSILLNEIKKAGLSEKDFSKYGAEAKENMINFKNSYENFGRELTKEEQKQELQRIAREKEWKDSNLLQKPLIWTKNNLKDLGSALKIDSKLQHIDNPGGFSLGNLKASTWNAFADLGNTLRFVANLPGDGLEFVGEVGDIVAHPLDTISSASSIAGAGLSKIGVLEDTEERKAIREGISQTIDENFGTVDRFLETINKNPIDTLTSIFGGLSLAKGGLNKASNLANKMNYTKTAENITNIANKLDKVQDIAIAPVRLQNKLALKGVSKATDGIGELSASVLGMTTGKGKDTIKNAFKYGGDIDYQKALRGELTQEDILEKAKKAFETIKEQRKEVYGLDYEKLKQNKNLLDLSDIKEGLKQYLDDMKVGLIPDEAGGYKIDFSSSTITQANSQKQIIEMVDDIIDWKNTTPEGLDILKQRLQDRWLGGEGTAKSDNLSTFLSNKVKEKIVAEVPEYAEMTRKYEFLTNELKEIDKVLSLSDKKSKMTALTRLNQTLKGNTAFRKEMLEKLEDLAGVNLKSAIAGANLSELTPNGLMATIGTAGIGYGLATAFTPTGIVGLATMSPRVIGETAKILGTSKNVIKKAGKTAKEVLNGFSNSMENIRGNNVSRFSQGGVGKVDEINNPSGITWNGGFDNPRPGTTAQLLLDNGI
ncbi:hypothetical protein DLH72_05080, partial [Candidatus Gracilibacteria bacterium]